jgi:hypothetical protein
MRKYKFKDNPQDICFKAKTIQHIFRVLKIFIVKMNKQGSLYELTPEEFSKRLRMATLYLVFSSRGNFYNIVSKHYINKMRILLLLRCGFRLNLHQVHRFLNNNGKTPQIRKWLNELYLEGKVDMRHNGKTVDYFLTEKGKEEADRGYNTINNYMRAVQAAVQFYGRK